MIKLHEDRSGILPEQWIDSAISKRVIAGARSSGVQPGSLDLHVSADGVIAMPYTVTPGNASKGEWLARGCKHASIGEDQDGRRRYLLLPDASYVVPCDESLKLPSNVFALANPKSSIGRIDVHVRVLTEHGHAYDYVPRGYEGALYLEIVPRSFPVIVTEEEPLAQLRFVSNSLEELDAQQLQDTHEQQTIVRYTPVDSALDSAISTEDNDVVLTAALRGAKNEIVAFCAHRGSARPWLDLSERRVDPTMFWKPIYACDEFVLDPGAFYLLRSRELLSIPEYLCAEMRPFNAAQGEFRAHYAGFFDNGFGLRAPSAAVLEVRNHHSAPMLLTHGQPFCRLRFLRFTKTPASVYGGSSSHYQGQRLALAKFFAPWPKP